MKGAPETLDDLIDETDSEDEENASKKVKKSKGNNRTGIVEDGVSFVDFLDKTAPQHFTGKQSIKGKLLNYFLNIF